MGSTRSARWFRVLTIAVAAIWLTSCATLIHGGGTQTVSINTDPSEAKVHVGGQEIISPSEITLDRNRNYQVIATKEGYEQSTTMIDSRFSWVTVLDLIFILPWVIDLVSGSAYYLTPDTVSLVLTPKPAPTPAANPSPAGR